MGNTVWFDIPKYETLYKINKKGQVKSFNGKLLKGGLNDKGYLYYHLTKSKYNSKKIACHKLMAITFLNHKPCGHKVVVDHINNNREDNRLENLQLVSNRINCTKDAKSKSGMVGVSFMKNRSKYRARIKINGKEVHLGLYKTSEEASKAYQNKLKELKY